MTELIVNNVTQLLHEWIVCHYFIKLINDLSYPTVPCFMIIAVCFTIYKCEISGKIK